MSYIETAIQQLKSMKELRNCMNKVNAMRRVAKKSVTTEVFKSDGGKWGYIIRKLDSKEFLAGETDLTNKENAKLACEEAIISLNPNLVAEIEKAVALHDVVKANTSKLELEETNHFGNSL